MKKQVFRKAALERLATTEQLNKVLKITSPLSWLALIGVTGLLAVVIIWSFVGTLPSTVTANGIIVNANTSTNTYLAPASGIINYKVHEGDLVDIGTEIASITQNNRTIVTCYSNQRGYITEILAANSSAIIQDAELIRFRPYMTANQKQVAVGFIPISDVNKIKRGMDAIITLSSADVSVYGHMEARVINIDSWATSNKGIESIVGTDNNMAAQLLNNGSVSTVVCEIYPSTGDSKNGYYWSNERGNDLDISNRMMCSVKIVTKEERPITKLLSSITEILGGK